MRRDNVLPKPETNQHRSGSGVTKLNVPTSSTANTDETEGQRPPHHRKRVRPAPCAGKRRPRADQNAARCNSRSVAARGATDSPLFGNGLRAGVKRDLARDIAAILDLDLGIGDLARDMAAGADQQPLADSELALEPAADLGIVDRRTSLEEPALG